MWYGGNKGRGVRVRFKEHDSKSCVPLVVPGVRIPPSPPVQEEPEGLLVSFAFKGVPVWMLE